MRNLRAKGDSGPVGAFGDHLDAGDDDFADIDICFRNIKLARFGLRDVENIADQVEKMGPGSLDIFGVSLVIGLLIERNLLGEFRTLFRQLVRRV